MAGAAAPRHRLPGDDSRSLGARLKQLGCPTLFVLEGGYATADLGLNAVAVLDGFEREGGR